MNRHVFLGLFLFSALAGLAYGSQLNRSSYTPAQANVIMGNATAYVNAVNESGYLIFYPNLTQAYGYLNRSYSLYPAEPTDAVYYAALARSSAESQYARISYYKSVSFAVMVMLTAIVAAVLYLLMRPLKARRR